MAERLGYNVLSLQGCPVIAIVEALLWKLHQQPLPHSLMARKPAILAVTHCTKLQMQHIQASAQTLALPALPLGHALALVTLQKT